VINANHKSFHCMYFNHCIKCIWLLNVNAESKAQYTRFGVLTTVLLLDSGLLRCDAVLLGEWFPAFYLGMLDPCGRRHRDPLKRF
jgi:hypothetical protein